MKKNNKLAVLLFVGIIISLPNYVHAFSFQFANVISNTVSSSDIYQIRNLKLDTKGKELLSNSEEKKEGSLIETNSLGFKIKDWKVDYELKGHSRAVCDPPMMNISFDKTDSKGRPKELFSGYSTYANYKTLQYQKIRLIPDCDVWNDYYSFDGGSDSGFGGLLKPNLKEYMIHKIFRAFGVPTADVVGFTNLTFVSPDSKYNGKTFRYMIIQRPNEDDDQIPFTKQFNLTSIPYLSGDDSLWMTDEWDGDDFNTKVRNHITNEVRGLEFEPISMIKFSLLTDFVNLYDVGFLHNEDGGVDAVTGKIIKIPHGFDMSFVCNIDSAPRSLGRLPIIIGNIKDENRREIYRNIAYKTAKELFTGKQNLDKILGYVDSYPYSDSNKAKLKDFLKIKYYIYSKYVNSNEFANEMVQPFVEQEKPSLPFETFKEFEIFRDNFERSCTVPKKILKDVNITQTEKVKWNKLSINENGDVADMSRVTFRLNIKTGSSGLEILKNSGAFTGLFLDKNSDNEFSEQHKIDFRMSVVSGIEDIAGPYYIIPANSSVVLDVYSDFDNDSLVKGIYGVSLNSFTPNYRFLSRTLDYNTDNIQLGTNDPFIITSPKPDEKLILGDKYEISWTGFNNKSKILFIEKYEEEGYLHLIAPDSLMGNYYKWTVGNVYNGMFDGKESVKILSPGRYRLIIISNQDKASRVSSDRNKKNIFYFTIIDPKNELPKIDYVTPQKVSTGASLDIYGKNFSKGYSNVVTLVSSSTANCPPGFICGNKKSIFKINANSKNETSIQLQVPDMPSGIYDLYIEVPGSGVSNTVTVNILKSVVPTIEVVGKPQLKLVLDKNGNELDLISYYTLKISSGDVSQKINKINAFNNSLRNNNYNVGLLQQNYKKPEGILDNNPDYYTIPANKSAIFNIENRYKVNQMFAGIYTDYLDHVLLNDLYLQVFENNKTNSVTVIGEKSPYINSIMNAGYPNQKVITLSPGDVLKINGTRFSTSIDSTLAFYSRNQVCARNLPCRISSKYNVRSKDGKNIDFTIPNIFDDNYYIQVIDEKTGASNMIEIIITKPKLSSPSAVTTTPSASTPVKVNTPAPTPTATTLIITPSPTISVAPVVSVSPSISPTVSPTTSYITPHISRISPTSGVAGTTVTLDGVNFEGVDMYSIFLRNNKGGEINPDNVVVTSTRITFKIPNTSYDTYSVSLFGNKGDSNTVNFTITAPKTNTSSIFDWFLTFFN